MTPRWPSKDYRESFEINGFIEHYQKLPHGRILEVVEKRDKPDYILRDPASNVCFGVELTSVYLNDRRVPDVYMKPVYGIVFTLYWPTVKKQIALYKQRIIERISQKLRQAKSGYDTSLPLILSVYLTEDVVTHITEEEWAAFVKQNESFFDKISPFCEVVFWPLQDDGVLSVKPQAKPV